MEIEHMTSDQIEEELGNDFYEIKRLVSGGFCAYSTSGHLCRGTTFQEAMGELLKAVREKREWDKQPHDNVSHT